MWAFPGGAAHPVAGPIWHRSQRDADDKTIDLHGITVLVVEDEFFAALQIEAILGRLGCAMVGPISNLPDAVAAARLETFDAAILDINLSGEMVYPVADALRKREIPILFATGYAAADVIERYRTFPRIGKPYRAAELIAALKRIL